MIEALGWPSLELRRRVARLSLLHKMVNDQVLMTSRSLLIPYPHHTKSMPPHAFTPLDMTPPKLYYATSFFPRTVAEWNSLPHDIASAPSLEAFKTSVTAALALP